MTAHHPEPMQVGLFLSADTVARDPIALRDIVQAAEALGCARFAAPDHVLGAHPERPGGWTSPYTHENAWHEPLVLFGYLAALTQRIQFMTGVLIMPQRATALVAKQAVEIDVLSGGRFVLGIGSGWNTVEYESLGRDFHNRGRRMEEQIALLRALWREPVVTFEGKYERVFKAGLNPLPSGDIPIWLGGSSDAALDRIGRVGDGWYVLSADVAVVKAGMQRIHHAAGAAGRDADHIGLQTSVMLQGDLGAQAAQAEAWRAAGATHVMAREVPGMASPGALIEALRAFVAAVGAEGGSSARAAHGAHGA